MMSMADDCCPSGGSCSAPPPLKLPEAPAAKSAPAASWGTVDACSCSGGVPVFEGVDPRYKRILWTVIGLNATMFVVEMVMGHLAGSQALQADALGVGLPTRRQASDVTYFVLPL